MLTELEAMKALKAKGFKYVVQFKNKGEQFGDPIAFKSADAVGPLVRTEKLEIIWNRRIDDYIEILEKKS